MNIEDAHAGAFVHWLMGQGISSGRGDALQRLKVRPDGRFWLARIAPEQKVRQSRLGERGERLEPCAIGIRVRPTTIDGREISCRVRFCAWRELPHSDEPDADKWEKTAHVETNVTLSTPCQIGKISTAGHDQIAAALSAVGAQGLSAEIHAEIEPGKDGNELVITLVNVSPDEVPQLDSNLYEAELEVQVGSTEPFLLEGIEDTFRYDRRVPAYGINGGVRQVADGVFCTTDYGIFDQKRLIYWDEESAGEQPDLSFAGLAAEPISPLTQLASCLQRWIQAMWADEALRARAVQEGWSGTTADYAFSEALKAREEGARVRQGVDLLGADQRLRQAFQLANQAFHEAPAILHTSWRPFQLGFVLANLTAVASNSERDVVDTIWFATGGGKTETYLLYSLTAAFYDRLRGKREGITSWARFPLRMLSLDQTQRFLDVLAAAELVRRVERIGGDSFSVGFFVGQGGTPNAIKKDARAGEPDPNDPDMPGKYRVLLRCPFCRSDQIEMRFDRARWALDHVCNAAECRWRGQPLPFRIVDEEIYRWLPTVVLGTLDKAASVAVQAAMRGFYGPPTGRCPQGHGFTYAPRSKSPTGCLYPDCREQPQPLTQDRNLYAPTIRMQDELHLLRDSLGSIDAHYEALFDFLQRHYGSQPKLIASSATLAGHDMQVRALYRRAGRMFPLPGPRATHSFWAKASDRLARRYVGVAPRGVTLEYANDQLIETLQRSVRRAITDPDAVATEAGIPASALVNLLSAYGVDVVYGSTLKDVEAAARSFEAQIPIERLNSVTLTGRTPLDEVRAALNRLKNPEQSFDERIHLVAASSMLSHGVDIDRLNVMIMLGLPLSTAEFIQTTARVGRRYPGLVFVFHKIARERDAAVFRMFPAFIAHMDRLIDPVPITSRSRRVLEVTFSGLEQARMYGVYEPQAIQRGLKQMTTPAAVRRAFQQLPVPERREYQEFIQMLSIEGPLDENLRRDLEDYLRRFYRELNDPASSAQWVSDLFPTGAPMMSLRDVEQQVPVYSRGGA